MPKQNRVTPSGEIIATPARGTLMGNRGCLHNERQELRRLFGVKRWIFCKLQFKNRRRTLMKPGFYTELFFLDEAVALAAGHRPCAECNRPKFNQFRSIWVAANPDLTTGALPPATALDAILHEERIDSRKQKVIYRDKLSQLPNGTFVILPPNDQTGLVYDDALLVWSPSGYSERLTRPTNLVVSVLTPHSIVKTLANGYRAELHPTAWALGKGEGHIK